MINEVGLVPSAFASLPIGSSQVESLAPVHDVLSSIVSSISLWIQSLVFPFSPLRQLYLLMQNHFRRMLSILYNSNLFTHEDRPSNISFLIGAHSNEQDLKMSPSVVRTMLKYDFKMDHCCNLKEFLQEFERLFRIYQNGAQWGWFRSSSCYLLRSLTLFCRNEFWILISGGEMIILNIIFYSPHCCYFFSVFSFGIIVPNLIHH